MGRMVHPQPPEGRSEAGTASWSRIDALFETALALHGEERELFLDRVREESVALRDELDSLLANHDEAGEFLHSPIAPPEDKQIGARIGAYRIEKEIGRGGMGEVYLARRADREFDKRVAIKLIRGGCETALAISRFRRERQILAHLEHAYIARLLDGGTTPQGLPYFVMEYVEGEPIHRYCDAHSLTTRDRLSLFLKVCSAVQYAHERNIIHRDLKPGNILVKKDGTPKLLDFGIAKIVETEGAGAGSDAWQQTIPMLTPAYASPEQLRGGTATSRSDIYSLGVILYELLCGKLPEDVHFRRTDPVSVRTHEMHLSPHLRAMIARSMDPDPAKRYPSVERFTADIRRYLAGDPPAANTERRAPRKQQKQWRLVYAAATCALILIALGLVWLLTRPPVLPFSNTRFTKLTTNGTAESAVISPDGKTLVYAARESDGIAIWSRYLPTGRTLKLVDRVDGKLGDLAFTKNGASIQFVTFPAKSPAARRLSVVPVGGGPVTRINQEFPGPVSLDMAGRRLAFYLSNLDAGADELVLTDLATGSKRLLLSFQYPMRFAWNCRPTWSSDGKHIAYAAEDRDPKGFLVRLWIVDVETGTRHSVISPRWQWVQSIEWTRKNSALVVVGQEQESSFQQIWYIPYPRSRAPARRIGSDLDDYTGASLTASGSELVSIQSETLSNIYAANENDLSHPVQLTPGTGRYFDLSWVPDGRILYASDATGSADLWLMNANGTGQRQITFGTGRNYAPAASPDSKSIAFHSNRTGNWQIWRAGMDGSNPKQLSSSSGDGNWPQFTADGNSLVFHRTSTNGIFNLWHVSVQGGRAHLLTPGFAMHPAVSRASGRIAAWYSDKTDQPEWKLAIFAPDGGAPLYVLNPTPNARPDTLIRWMPNDEAITFIDYARSAANIWMLPLDGRPPRALTSFESGDIFSFDWSPQRRLVYSRGFTTSDVVLIRDLSSFQKDG